MPRVSIRRQIADKLETLEAGLRGYFAILEELLDNVSSSEPALAYRFQSIESAQRMSLYVLLMREYGTNSEMTWKAVDSIDITRKSYPEKFKAILDKDLDDQCRTIIAPAERIRDAIMHGRSQSKAKIQSAILCCLNYAEFVNLEFYRKAGFKPYGPLTGFTSKRGRPQLSKKVSAAVLRGLAFL
jgi:hypothetical protein